MEELLSIKLRPKKLSDVIGQKHLIGKDKILTNLVKNKKLFSMILYGKPGIGKTSIAMAIVNELDVKYRMLNAVINNKKDFDTKNGMKFIEVSVKNNINVKEAFEILLEDILNNISDGNKGDKSKV